MTRWLHNPDRYDCSWCARRRFRSMVELDWHERQHEAAERAMRERECRPSTEETARRFDEAVERGLRVEVG